VFGWRSALDGKVIPQWIAKQPWSNWRRRDLW
jgi:hypothetical protein